MHHGTVGSGLTIGIMLFHNALEAFALGLADHIDDLPGLEMAGRQIELALDFFTRREAKFADALFGFRGGFAEVAQLCLLT